jgi:hypothetical protein
MAPIRDRIIEMLRAVDLNDAPRAVLGGVPLAVLP